MLLEAYDQTENLFPMIRERERSHHSYNKNKNSRKSKATYTAIYYGEIGQFTIGQLCKLRSILIIRGWRGTGKICRGGQ